GERNKRGRKPQMRRTLSVPRTISVRRREGVRKQNRGRCDQVWLAIRWPSAHARRTISGYWSARFPITKNVAFTFFSRSRSSNLGVDTGSGPSSKVKAMQRLPVTDAPSTRDRFAPIHWLRG